MFLVKSFKLNCVLRLADVAETALSLIENPLFYVFLFQYLCVPFRKKVNRSKKKKNSITKLCLCPLSLSLFGYSSSNKNCHKAYTERAIGQL